MKANDNYSHAVFLQIKCSQSQLLSHALPLATVREMRTGYQRMSRPN